MVQRDGRPLCGVQARLVTGSSSELKGAHVRFRVDKPANQCVCSDAALDH